MKKTIYSEEHSKIVQKLKQARIEAGFKQSEVAKRLGRTQSFMSKIESGQTRVDLVQIKVFAKLYNKSIEYFLE